MPNSSTFPTLYDELNQLDITFLKKHGYLKPNQIVSGVITWSRKYDQSSSISIKINTVSEDPRIVLSYTSNGEPIEYSVQLYSITSNIGKGVIWYFICPYTRKRCRKLYFHNSRFYHRDAFKNCMYQTQTFSRHSRFLCTQLDRLYAKQNACKQIESKYFTKYYNGKQTKKYSKLLKQIAKGQGISEAALLMS